MRHAPFAGLAAIASLSVLCAPSVGAQTPPPARTRVAPLVARVIPDGLESAFLDALKQTPDDPPGGSLELQSISVGSTEVSALYLVAGTPVPIRLTRRTADCRPGLSSREFCVIPGGGTEAGARLAAWVVARLDASGTKFWITVVPGVPPREASVQETSPRIVPWFPLAGVFWLALAAVLALGLVRRFRHGAPGTWAVDAVLVASSLGVRLLAATWGPGDLALNLDTVFTGNENTRYGTGPDPILIPLVRLLAGDDRTVIAFNLLVGSLCPSMLLAFLRRLDFAEDRTRVAAAILLAFLPLPVRFSGECNRQALVLFLGLASLWGLAGIRRGSALPGAVATITAAALTFMTRPEGALVLILLGLLALPLASTRRTAWPIVAVATASALFLVYFLDFHAGNPTSRTYVSLDPGWARLILLASPGAQTWLDPRFTPLAVLVGVSLALRRTRWRQDPGSAWAVFSLAGLGFLFVVMPGSPGGILQIANARYQTLSAIPLVLLAAVGGSGLWTLSISRPAVPSGAARFALVGVSLFSVLVASRAVQGPTDVDYEYLALREWVADLPPGSEIHHVYGWGRSRKVRDLSLRSPDYLSAVLHRPDVAWHEWPYEPGTPGHPQFFLLPAACAEARASGDNGEDFASFLEACDEGLRAADPTPYRQARFPFRRFMDARVGTGSIPIGLYRLPDVEGDPPPSP